MINLLTQIKKSLLDKEKFHMPKDVNFIYNPDISQIYITLLDEENQKIRWGAKKSTLELSIQRIIFKLKSNIIFDNFNIADNEKCKIMFEIVTKEYEYSQDNFESGISGLKYKYKGKKNFFMPSDKFTSITKQYETERLIKKINKKELDEYSLINSKAYTLYKNEVIEVKGKYSFDGFKTIKILGVGGFGKVILVQKDNVRYALKLINQTRFVNRIDQEIKALKVLNAYNNNLEFIKSKKSNNNSYLLFEYASGGDLKNHIEKNGVFDEKKALIFLSKILDILKFTKSKGLLHLDIKPANILLSNDSYWLADWGLSEFKQRIETLHIKGNEIFLAPEMYRGYREFPSEIYALGCTLYYVMTGKNPFELTNVMQNELKIYLHTYFDVDTSMIGSKKIVYLLNQMLLKDDKKRATIKELEDIIKGNITEVTTNCKKYTHAVDVYKIYKTMAKDGIAYGQNNLAKLYLKGKFVKKDTQAALKWFSLSAQSGLANAECNLGICYLEGKVIDKDYNKAFILINKAAQKGLDRAEYYLGTMYENGFGTKKNYKESLKYYTKSANNGYKKAYIKLGESK